MYLSLLSVFFGLAVARVPLIPGYTLQWSDDFAGTGKTSPSSAWKIDTGTQYPGGPAQWGTGEVETYSSSTDNVCLTGDGYLQITPLKAARGGGWVSGRIETNRADFMAQPGGKMHIEARIMMPAVTGAAAAGYWPAFWTLGSSYRSNSAAWPNGGEFDIMEDVNGINAVYGTLHCGTNPNGPCNEPNGLGNNVQCPGSSCAGNFHVYSFEVDRTVSPETLKWFVDGQQYQMVTSNQVGDSAWNSAVHQGHFILLDVAIGGGFPNALAGGQTPTAQTESGHPMLVDYVGVYYSS